MLKTYHSLCKQNVICLSKAHKDRDQPRTKKAIWKIPVSTNFLTELQQDGGGRPWLKQQRKRSLGLVCLGNYQRSNTFLHTRYRKWEGSHQKLMVEKTKFRPIQHWQPDVSNTKPVLASTERARPPRVLMSTGKPPKTKFLRDKKNRSKTPKWNKTKSLDLI